MLDYQVYLKLLISVHILHIHHDAYVYDIKLWHFRGWNIARILPILYQNFHLSLDRFCAKQCQTISNI